MDKFLEHFWKARVPLLIQQQWLSGNLSIAERHYIHSYP